MNLLKTPLQTLKEQAVSHLKAKGFEIDYVEITDTTLQTVSDWDEKSPLVGLIAVTLNNIRLIDNMVL